MRNYRISRLLGTLKLIQSNIELLNHKAPSKNITFEITYINHLHSIFRGEILEKMGKTSFWNP